MVAPTEVTVGDEFLAEVHVADVVGLFSAPLFVNYNPALLELVTAGEGEFLGLSGEDTVFSFTPNPATGQMVVGNKQENGAPGESGSGSLFLMEFRAKAPGSARIELDRINFRDRDGTRIEVAPAAMSITIK
jgi:general secretion pathway protein D